MSRPYTGAFILSKTKLARICDILEKRFSSVLIPGSQLSFEVVLANRKTHSVRTLDEVLTLDNSLKNRIREFEIRFTAGPEDEPAAEVRVNFDGNPVGDYGIYCFGRALDSTWLRETVAEIEEQIDRIRVSGIMYSLSLSPISALRTLPALLVFLMLLMITSTFVGLKPPADISAEAIEAITRSAQIAVSQEDKIDVIFDYAKGVIAAKRETAHERDNSTRLTRLLGNVNTYLIAIPMLIIVASFVYLLVYCYPRYVFEWGDYGDHHTRLIEQRKTIWNLAVSSLVIGIIGNAFVLAFSSYWTR